MKSEATKAIDKLQLGRCAQQLADCENAWRTAHLSRAVADAVKICQILGQPPSDWIIHAVAVLAYSFTTPFDHRRHRQDLIHHTRWELVRDLRERRHEFDDDRGTSWERCYETVSEALEGTVAAGSPDTIKASYNIVQRALKKDVAGGSFYLNNVYPVQTLIGKRSKRSIGKR
jgi:hypothetical protein